MEEPRNLIFICIRNKEAVNVFCFGEGETFNEESLFTYLATKDNQDFIKRCIQTSFSPCLFTNLKEKISEFCRVREHDYKFKVVYLCDVNSQRIYRSYDLNKPLEFECSTERDWRSSPHCPKV